MSQSSLRFGSRVRLAMPFVVIPVALVACAAKHTTDASSPGTTPIAASQELDALKTAGLDPTALPDLDKLGKDNLKPVMHSFADSLGVSCDECHAPKTGAATASMGAMGMAAGAAMPTPQATTPPSTTPAPGGMPAMGMGMMTGPSFDFDAWTPKKRLAAKMWSEFVQKLEFADGSPLYCDSCHGKKAAFLDRSDDDTLAAWMHENFVGKLVTKQGKQPLQCQSCHGMPFDGHFLEKWEMEMPATTTDKPTKK